MKLLHISSNNETISSIKVIIAKTSWALAEHSTAFAGLGDSSVDTMLPLNA